MKSALLITGAVAVSLMAAAATPALARYASDPYAEPSQPVPYAQLGAYMKATPHKRTALLTGGAMTGAAVNTAATMPAPPAAPANQATNPTAVNPATPPAPAPETTGATAPSTASTPTPTEQNNAPNPPQ